MICWLKLLRFVIGVMRKHRGGIEYYGLKPKHLFRVEVSVHEKKMDTTNLFSLPVVNIDEEMESVMRAYEAIIEAVKKMNSELIEV